MNRIIDGISLKKINFILKIMLIASVISVIAIGGFGMLCAGTMI